MPNTNFLFPAAQGHKGYKTRSEWQKQQAGGSWCRMLERPFRVVLEMRAGIRYLAALPSMTEVMGDK